MQYKRQSGINSKGSLDNSDVPHADSPERRKMPNSKLLHSSLFLLLFPDLSDRRSPSCARAVMREFSPAPSSGGDWRASRTRGRSGSPIASVITLATNDTAEGNVSSRNVDLIAAMVATPRRTVWASSLESLRNAAFIARCESLIHERGMEDALTRCRGYAQRKVANAAA